MTLPTREEATRKQEGVTWVRVAVAIVRAYISRELLTAAEWRDTIDYRAAEIRRQLGGTAEEIVDAAVGKENNDED